MPRWSGGLYATSRLRHDQKFHQACLPALNGDHPDAGGPSRGTAHGRAWARLLHLRSVQDAANLPPRPTPFKKDPRDITRIRLQGITASQTLYSRFPQPNEFDEQARATSQTIEQECLAAECGLRAEIC